VDDVIRIAAFPAPRGGAWRELVDTAGIDLVACRRSADCLDLVVRADVDAVVVEGDAEDPAVTELLRQLRAGGAVPVVAATDSECPEVRSETLDVGAHVLMSPSTPRAELLAQLRSLSRLCTRRSAPTLVLHHDTMEVEHDGARVPVTNTQWKLLAVLCSRPGRFFSAAELTQRVWGHTTGPTSTVSVHLRRLRIKLERDPSRPTIIRTERGRGYSIATTATSERVDGGRAPTEADMSGASSG
jgi:DNA-binding response OmpR family regulator